MSIEVGSETRSAVKTGKAVVVMEHSYEFLEALPHPVVILDNEFHRIYGNAAMVEMDERFGRFRENVPKADFDRFKAELSQHGRCQLETRVPTREGSFWYRMSGKATSKGYVCTVTDLTMEKMAQLEAERHEEWYRGVLDAAQEGVWQIKLQTGERYWCPRIRAKLGISADAEITDETFAHHCHPDDLERVREERRLHVDTGRRFHVESRWLMSDGNYRWLALSGDTFRDEAGRPLVMMGTIQDVHDRKLSESNLQEANRLLEGRVAQRTRELADTNAELQSFCYSVSHDLRGPLRGINGFGKALEEDFGEVLGPVGLGYVERIRSASLRLSGLIDALLSLSRITRAEMRRESLDVGELCREAFEDLQRAYPEQEASLRAEAGLHTFGDVSLVRLAINNLIENAWKFSSKKQSVLIEVGREKGAFFVRDHGAGFEMNFAAKLFQPFERLHAESEFPGTGIGLAVTQRVIQRHQGEIWAIGAPGEGATFYFTLPARKRDRHHVSP